MIGLILEISWAIECVALAVQVVSRYCGCLPWGLLIIHTNTVKVEISMGLGEGLDNFGMNRGKWMYQVPLHTPSSQDATQSRVVGK